MFNFKRVTSIFLLVGVLIISTVSVMATNKVDSGGERNIAPVNSKIITEMPSFQPFTGIVREIDKERLTDSQYVFVETDEGKTAYLIVNKETYFVNERELKEGSVVTGYFDANLPIIMIYPPQYSAVVIIVEPEKEENIKVDRFDHELVSSDNMLKLNMGDETKIILQDGKPFSGELTDRDLVVSYEVSTKSIPAQTTPRKIVVLFEEAVPPIYNIPGGTVTPFLPDVGNMEIVVENKVIEAPAAYYNQDNTVMVPLRAITAALGFNVTWDHAKKLVMLDDSFTVTIGDDTYMDISRDKLISLEAAPALVEGRTFVPLHFFREVLTMNSVYVFEEQIVIDNDEDITC